jgi:enamine deaminase RidA (YjgF/YER057c/UK114 family)
MSQSVLPDGWPPAPGYAEARLAPLNEGSLLTVAGQLGVPIETVAGAPVPSFVEQWRFALQRLVDVVAAAGGGPESIMSMRVFVVDLSQYGASLREIGRAYREIIGTHQPAITMVQVSALANAAAQIEIEAVALIGN